MFSLKRFKVAAIIVVTIVGTLSLFQNCSDVNFETTDELLKAGIDGTLRQVSFSPKFTENRPEIDVTTILDNSNSMSKIQSNVKEALASTTSVLKGFSGTFNLYTTTQEMSYSSRNRDELGFYKIQDENGDLIPSLTFTASDLPGYKAAVDIDGNPLHSTYEQWKKHLNYSPYSSINFSKNMNDVEFKKFQGDVGIEVQKVDTSGSPNEVSLCSLLRNLDANQDSSSFHTYVIATNEDDASSVQNCLKEEGSRYNRVSSIQPGGQVNCSPGDAECNFPYTVTYRAYKKYRNQYKYSYVESQNINYALSGKGVITKKRSLSYRQTKRFVRHKLKQNSWELKFRRNVKIGENDGIPIYQEQGANIAHGNRPLSYGACSVGTTDFMACSGADLTYFNSTVRTSYPDAIAGTCELKCNNSNTDFITDYLEGSPIVVGDPVTFPEVDSYNLAGYTTGCNAYVAFRRAYKTQAIPIVNSTITDCSTGNDSITTQTPEYQVTKYYGTCGVNLTSCTAEEKTAAITQLGLGSIDPLLLTCANTCSSADFSSSVASSRVSAGNLCPGKYAGDAGATVSLECTAGEKTTAKNTLQIALTAQGLSATLLDSDISCSYTCKHSNSGYQTLGSTVTVDPWENLSTVNDLDCASSPFSGATHANRYSCRKEYFDDQQPSNGTFVSQNPSICDAGYTLSSIRAYPEAAGILDHGTARPLNSCTRGQGQKGGVDQLVYNWVAEEPDVESHIDSIGLIKTIKEKLNKAHGKNYFLAAFINDPSKEDDFCEGVNLEDYYGPSGSQLEYEGKKFKSLEKELGSKQMKTFPACMPDYKQAMKFVFDLIVTSAKKSYMLALNEDKKEWVYRVKILDKYGIIQTLKEEQFNWDKGLLNFDDSVDLSSVEMIYVDIVIPNLPPEEIAQSE